MSLRLYTNANGPNMNILGHHAHTWPQLPNVSLMNALLSGSCFKGRLCCSYTLLCICWEGQICGAEAVSTFSVAPQCCWMLWSLHAAILRYTNILLKVTWCPPFLLCCCIMVLLYLGHDCKLRIHICNVNFLGPNSLSHGINEGSWPHQHLFTTSSSTKT